MSSNDGQQPSTAKLRIWTLRIWGFRGPGFRSARHVFCGDASRLFLAHFPKHLNSVLGRTELCHEVRNPRPPKPQIIRKEDHRLALLEAGITSRCSIRLSIFPQCTGRGCGLGDHPAGAFRSSDRASQPSRAPACWPGRWCSTLAERLQDTTRRMGWDQNSCSEWPISRDAGERCDVSDAC